MTKETKDRLATFVCERLQVKYSDIFKRNRKQSIVTARQIIMAVMSVNDKSETLTSILQYFDGAVTNHATVWHAIKVTMETHYLDDRLRQCYIDAIAYVDLCKKFEDVNEHNDFYSRTLIFIDKNLHSSKSNINFVEN